MKPLNERGDHLAILVATYNRLELLKRTLASIRGGARCSHEVFVIDGGSSDGTIEYLRSHGGATPVFQGRLLGTARCYNEVWRRVRSKYTCWLSDDTEVTPGSLDLAVSILESDPAIGMVGLKMKDTVGWGSGREYMGAVSAFGILNCNHGVLRQDLLAAVGYFNEAYRSYTIDPDLTASVLCTGKWVVMTKRIAVLHHRGWEGNGRAESVSAREATLARNLGIYREKFRFLADGVSRSALRDGLKARTGRIVGRVLFKGVEPRGVRFGLNRRDWYNITYGRFIRLTDSLENRGRPYHLVQRMPRWLLRSEGNPYRHLVGEG
ncbi:MAG: glycosyltransferase [Gemmatimonadetes bacterium]|nr:glycosyltransferase [Gemmatimonadota bacterium]